MALGDMDEVFGILPTSEKRASADMEDVIEILLDVRRELRKRKQFDLADSIRDKLKAKGIELQDSSDGAKWRLAD